MSDNDTLLWRGHAFLARRSFYALALASGLALAMWLGRVWLARSMEYRFMLWNLFLAWMPYLLALSCEALDLRWPRRWRLVLAPGALWLLFLPNGLYLITDLAHLHIRGPQLLWYDTGMLATFAWAGVFLSVCSLRMLQRIVASYLGHAGGWLFVLGVSLLAGLGVYLGRFLRWNSWDLFTDPAALLSDIAGELTRRYALGMTGMFAAIMLVCYLTVLHHPLSPSSRRGDAGTSPPAPPKTARDV